VVPTPYAVGPANMYCVTASPVTLIDCGPNTPAAEKALMAGLERVGVRPSEIEQVVISHGHPDHFGMAPRLRELSGCRILIGRDDLPKLADDSMLMATGKLLLQEGMPMSALVDMGVREQKLGSIRPRVPDAEPVDGGERLAFDGFDLEVLHLPGHTAGHICLWHEPTGTLFSGDTLLLNISPNPLLEPNPLDRTERRRSLVEYLETLDKLAALPLSTVYPGHGPIIERPHELIEDMRRHHAERTAELAGMLDAEGQTAWQLANRLFPKLEGFDNFLAVSEVAAHMDLLVAAARAEPFEQGGITYYRAA
jgi:glyoxylase-like metal-dependent hydrolase (beta-lactamase superfamily II)